MIESQFSMFVYGFIFGLFVMGMFGFGFAGWMLNICWIDDKSKMRMKDFKETNGVFSK